MRGIAAYDFVRPLGKGSHGEFFMARRPTWLPVDARYVTVKVVGAGEDGYRQATRELNAFAAVRSRYLVTLYDAGHESGNFYYSMEFLPAARSLRAPQGLQRRRRLLMALAHAARAVQDLHDAGLVHCDIKPENILLTGEGGKLADLGLVRPLSPRTELTRMGTLPSMEFVDPSVLGGEEPSPAADVWSLGATAHWLLSGRGLYSRLPIHDPLLALRMVLSSQPHLAEGIDPEIAGLLRTCFDEPDKRSSAAEMAARLESLAHASSGDNSTAGDREES
ncbi:serine/threonine protein kinase [Actinomadura madurae]|nr:serine/threonine-protein kinase [Actinomadura madurae]URN05372.1 serine/threonine protein kinase [Actinomadura madurae]